MPLTLLLHGRHAPGQVPYQPLGPWLVPWRLGSFETEYQALRQAAGLLDYSIQALIEVRGADRTRFLQALLTNDIAALAPGGGCPAALLDPAAKLIATLLVLADAEALWLLCDLDRAAAVTQTLERYHFTEDVRVTNRERAHAALALQGPGALAVAQQLAGRAVPLERPGQHCAAAVDSVPVRFVRHQLTDEPGVLCLVPAEGVLAVWEAWAHRAPALGLTLVGWEALNAARLEAGIPWFGLDLDATTLLPETGLEERLASDTKGCYVGQEIVARMRTYGSASKKLMGLVCAGERVPSAGDALVRDGADVGRVTSACWSPALGRPLALGYVKRGTYEPGTAVEILCHGARAPATVVPRPPVTRPASSGRTRAGA
jgi:aminomethyltransferase